MRDPILIRSVTSPERLVLLFHGVGSTAESMVPLGQQIAAALSRAAVFSVPSPDASDLGQGYQWFSVRGITEANRVQRVAEAMPRFTQTIEKLQKATGVAAAQTTLVGFSQGAIMSLESTQVDEPLVRHVVSLAGRFARLPGRAPIETELHFIHGRSDPVIAYGYAVSAAERLLALGADVTLDLVPQLAHGINRETAELLVKRLKAPAAERRHSQADGSKKRSAQASLEGSTGKE